MGVVVAGCILAGSLIVTLLIADLLCLGGRTRIVGIGIFYSLLFGAGVCCARIGSMSWLAGSVFFLASLVLSLCIYNMKSLNAVYAFFARTRTILAHNRYGGLPSKTSLLWLCLRVELEKLLCNDRVSKKSFSSTTVFYLSVSQFRCLVLEIFIDREYCIPGLGSQPFIIDCGANIGMTTLFLKKLYPQSTMLSFEPDPTNFQYLTENIAANRLQDVQLEQKALSNKDGQVAFSSGRHTESSTTYLVDNANNILVEAVRLSDYITRDVDLLKIDIEGAETEVFEDLEKSGKLVRIKNIIFEHHYTFADQHSLGMTLALLEKHNFSVEIRCFSNLTRPYALHHRLSQDKVYGITVFACSRNWGSNEA